MLTLLWIIYILDCLLLIGIILLQPGEGGDLAAAFGGASSQTAFGARGSATFMQKLTTGLAVLFMVLSIVLVMFSNRKQEGIMRALPPGSVPKATSEKPKPAPSQPGSPAQPAGAGQPVAVAPAQPQLPATSTAQQPVPALPPGMDEGSKAAGAIVIPKTGSPEAPAKAPGKAPSKAPSEGTAQAPAKVPEK